MAVRQKDGSIRMSDGRVVYGNSIIMAQDLLEIIPLFTPPPLWPFVGGGGGAPGPAGAAGIQGALGPQGPVGFGEQGVQGNQGNQGVGGAAGGPQGNQGNQGNTGVQGNQGPLGLQGAQGNFGPQGLQGNQGNQGPLGPQGAQGNQGNFGPQGLQGNQGNQGNQGFQGALPVDIFASTRVVDLTGAGTDLTIAAAIAALPAAGGYIYIKQGTFPQAATLSLPDKPIVFKGSGDSTIIDLGANAIAAFTIPGGTLTARREFVFEDMLIRGTSVAGQTFVSIGDADSRGVVSARRVNSTGIQFPFFITAGSGAPDFEPVTLHVDDCHFIPLTNGSSILVNTTPAIGVTVNAYMQRVRFYNIFLDTVAGALTGGGDFVDFTGVNILGEDCLFAIGTTGTVGALNLTDSVIFNFTGGANPIIAIGDDNNGVIPSCMMGCEAQFINFDIAGNGTDFIGGHYRACAFTDGAISKFTNCFMFTNPPGAATVILGTGDTYVIGCRFDNIGTSFVLDGNFQTISGNFFDGAPGTAIIRTTNGSAEIADNRFSGIVVPILELTSSTNNIDNNRWTTNPTLLADSDAIVNAFKRKNVTAQATVDALTAVFTHQNDKGLAGAGSIKNTGANSLTVRRTGTDGYGVTDFQEDPVLAGADFTWPMDTALGTALPSFTVFTVSVRSTTPGSPTTFDLRHSSTGAY